MKHEWLRAGFLSLAAVLVIAGCAGSSKETPLEPSKAPEERPDTITTPKAPVEPPASTAAFDPDGNPYIPGTTRLLGRTVYFDYDRAVIKRDDLAILEMHAEVLRKNRNRRVTVQGHCDERGTREYNLALGERRADAVRSFLTSAGVSRAQIEVVSFGEERPSDPGHDERAWSRNRRAVVQYR